MTVNRRRTRSPSLWAVAEDTEDRELALRAALQITHPTARLLEVAAIVSEDLVAETGTQPVLVGGLAVAYWTHSETSTDIDLLVPSGELAERLAALGFERRGRYWSAPGEQVVVEAPGSFPAPGERVVEVVRPSGRRLYVLGLEEVAADRLHQFRAGGHSAMFEQLFYLLGAPALDRGRLADVMRAQSLEGALAAVEAAQAEYEERRRPPETWELHELAKTLP